MSKVTEQESGVVGGALDVSRDTTTEEPFDITGEALARRHEADERGRQAALRKQRRPPGSSGLKKG